MVTSGPCGAEAVLSPVAVRQLVDDLEVLLGERYDYELSDSIATFVCERFVALVDHDRVYLATKS